MKRELHLQRRLNMLGTLNEAVSAMRSLSAHHFRLSRQALPATRAYREDVEQAIAEAAVSQDTNAAVPQGLLVVVSDLGLCGDYNTRLTQTAIDEYQRHDHGPLYCVGHRPRALLARHDITPTRLYSAPASVDGLPTLLLQLAEDLLDDFVRRQMGSLFVVSARFEGAGRFSPVITRLLPIHPIPAVRRVRPTRYLSPRRVTAVAVREFLYIMLHQLLLDSLASEHGMRLLASESARQWIDQTAERVRHELSACRREATTQEVLDIVSGSRPRMRQQRL